MPKSHFNNAHMCIIGNPFCGLGRPRDIFKYHIVVLVDPLFLLFNRVTLMWFYRKDSFSRKWLVYYFTVGNLIF